MLNIIQDDSKTFTLIKKFALGKFQSCDFGTAPIGPLTTCPLTTHLALLYWGINGFLTMTKESPVLAHFLGRGTSILSGLGLDDE